MSEQAWIERVRRSPSPCIRDQLARAGIAAENVEAGDLARLVPLRPADLDLDRLEDPVGYLRLGDAPPSSRLGTCERDGATIVLAWTGRDLARSAAAGARSLAAAGIAPGMRVANTLEGGFTTPGSLGLGDALEALGALDIPLGPAPDEKSAAPLLALIERIEVEVLVVDAASARGLLPLLAARRPPSLVGVVCAQTSVGLRLDPLPGCWQRGWLSVPEVAVFAAVECERRALHLDVDLRAEVSGGSLLLGALSGDTPLLRYDTGITARAVRSGCPCGDGRKIVA